ncbi:MAG: glutamate-1-semialdehyde 2,1-aminomutase [Candidatus Omnitrophota bacterium]
MKRRTSERSLYQKALARIPSGVNSPVRAFKAVGGDPLFVARGQGPWIWDEAGKRYLDFCMSWGALLFGHAPDGLVQTVQRVMADGTSFGIATAREVELAGRIREFFPSIEKSRLVNSGTEAVMSAIRLARGFTGRKKILKIDGGYHGHVDSLLVKAGSGAATFGVPDSAGVPEELARLTQTVPFNDFRALEAVFMREGKNMAAFILEPVPANMGVILPAPGYLELARNLTKKYGALLIFDEVITGFRLAPGGAQERFGIHPDLTCLGKILGGGFPLAAFGGKAEIMDELAPEGPVYQAGTLSGNPVAVAAALWMLSPKNKPGEPAELEGRTEKFCGALEEIFRKKKTSVQINRIASMFTIFFNKYPVTDYATAKASETTQFAKFHQSAMKKGLYFSPSQFEANFLSAVHTDKILSKTAPKILKAL